MNNSDEINYFYKNNYQNKIEIFVKLISKVLNELEELKRIQELQMDESSRWRLIENQDTISEFCEGVGLVNGGHTFFGRSAQVLYKLQGEEVEGVRQEVREVKDEENRDINGEGEPHTSWAHVDGMNDGHSSDLSRAVQSVCNVTMLWQTKDYRTMHSRVRVDVLCVEDSHGCQVVIGVGRVIVQCHHASITYQYWIFTFVLSV